MLEDERIQCVAPSFDNSCFINNGDARDLMTWSRATQWHLNMCWILPGEMCTLYIVPC